MSFSNAITLRICLLYLIFGIVWIIFSDKALLKLFPVFEHYALYQSSKGIIFVVVTTVFLFFILNQHINAKDRLFKELRNHEQFVHLAIQAGRVGVFSLDVKNDIVYMNNKFMDRVSLHHESLDYYSLNEFIKHLVYKEDEQKVKALFESLISGREREASIFYRILNTDGQIRWMQFRASVTGDEGEQVEKIIGVIVDFTEQKKLEHKLNNSKLLYENMLSNIAGMVYQCDFNHSNPKIFISDGCQLLMNMPPDEFKAQYKLLGNFIYEADRDTVWRAVIQSVKDNTNYAVQYRIKLPDGSIRWVEDRGQATLDAAGSLEFLVGVVYDITERVEANDMITTAIMDTEYNERSRISREIHDGLQQTLTSSFLQFQGLRSSIDTLDEKSQDKLLKGEGLLNKAIQESREIAHRLIPRDVESSGLVLAIENMVKALKDGGMEVSFEYNDIDESKISKSTQLVIYRILQESITNIRKYAGPCSTQVQLFQYADKLLLMVEDDGAGFDVVSLGTKNTGLGLANMKQRATTVGGFMEIDSFPGRGTCVLLEIPTRELESNEAIV